MHNRPLEKSDLMHLHLYLTPSRNRCHGNLLCMTQKTPEKRRLAPGPVHARQTSQDRFSDRWIYFRKVIWSKLRQYSHTEYLVCMWTILHKGLNHISMIYRVFFKRWMTRQTHSRKLILQPPSTM